MNKKRKEVAGDFIFEVEDLPDGTYKFELIKEIEKFEKLPENAEEGFICKCYGNNYIFEDNEWWKISHYQPSLYEVYYSLKKLEKRVEKLENKGE